jgi:predicted PurR-regulated permease PerM
MHTKTFNIIPLLFPSYRSLSFHNLPTEINKTIKKSREQQKQQNTNTRKLLGKLIATTESIHTFYNFIFLLVFSVYLLLPLQTIKTVAYVN